MWFISYALTDLEREETVFKHTIIFEHPFEWVARETKNFDRNSIFRIALISFQKLTQEDKEAWEIGARRRGEA